MSSLRSIADSRRSMATFIPVIAYGEWRCASDGARKRSADSTSAMPRRTSKWATVEATLPARRRLGFARKPLARASTDTASAGLAVHFIARPSRRHPKIHALQIDILRTSQAGLVVRLPHDTLHFFKFHIAVESAHAMAFDKGNHVVFDAGKVVRSSGGHRGGSR